MLALSTWETETVYQECKASQDNRRPCLKTKPSSERQGRPSELRSFQVPILSLVIFPFVLFR